MLRNGWFTQLYEEAKGDGEGGGGGGKGDGESKVDPDKIKIGTKEYKTKDLESAHTLYEALQDPETGREIIETLARKAGLLDKVGDVEVKPGETKKGAESRVARALKAKLGKDYDKFAEAVGPAFDEIITDMVKESLGERDSRNSQDNWSKAVDSFAEQYELTPGIEEVMKDLMEEAPPNFARKNFDAERYLTRMYKNALEELDEQPKTKERKVSNIKNFGRRAQAASRGERGDEVPEIRDVDPPKHASIDDAIEAAMKGIRFRRRG